MGKIAVITPTYNRGNNGLLRKTMLSVARQTHGGFYHVVVDDGSTDSTPAVVDALAREDRRVRYVRRERTPGQKFGASAASNCGIYHVLNDSTYDDVRYVTFVDSDDLLPLRSLERRIVVFDGNARLRAVYGSYGYCDSAMKLEYISAGPKISEPSRLVQCLKKRSGQFPNRTFMIDRELLEQAGGFDEHLGLGEDRDLSIRLLERLASDELRCLPDVFYYIRVHGDSVSAHYSHDNAGHADQAYFAAKHGRTRRDRAADTLSRALRRPHTLLPEAIKRPLRPIRDALVSTDNPIDPFVASIEYATP